MMTDAEKQIVRDAIALLEQSRRAFKSKQVAQARESLEQLLEDNMSPTKRIALNVTDAELEKEILTRSGEAKPGRGGGFSETLNTDLSRYYALLKRARMRLRELLSDGELALIIDVCNGWWKSNPEDALALWHNVYDGIEMDGLDQKWKIDGKALVRKLKPRGDRIEFGEHPEGRTFTELVALC
ncbi:MAG TPA: hypothetical protein VEF04_22065, partial [Blastocatellia bacterium]|nr:hypothetical protein [Blastocatellia bacterium]